MLLHAPAIPCFSLFEGKPKTKARSFCVLSPHTNRSAGRTVLLFRALLPPFLLFFFFFQSIETAWLKGPLSVEYNCRVPLVITVSFAHFCFPPSSPLAPPFSNYVFINAPTRNEEYRYRALQIVRARAFGTRQGNSCERRKCNEPTRNAPYRHITYTDVWLYTYGTSSLTPLKGVEEYKRREIHPGI